MSRGISLHLHRVALRKESVDRNTKKSICYNAVRLSLSARRAWIEIVSAFDVLAVSALVALRKESVDRNCRVPSLCFDRGVALRKESVDRNDIRHTTTPRPSMSLSARRAWIEILRQLQSALRGRRSLSARRAWIEILCAAILSALACVALRKESVDRNMPRKNLVNGICRRSPQGERG